MKLSLLKKIVLLGVLLSLTGLVWFFTARQERQTDFSSDSVSRAIPVEVAPIEHGPLALRRTFSGALEAPAQIVISPKVGGRVERLAVGLADTVSRGQLVAELDNDEYVQAAAQARAELAVAKANLVEARSTLEIAVRELERIERLHQRGVASETNLDTARANQLSKQARLEVARAEMSQAQAALETARIRQGYTRITADWSNGSSRRVVAERYVSEGDTVSANTPLLRIVELDPVTGVIFVTERDYGRLQPGLAVTLRTDAYPGRVFVGSVHRIAPVFREATRQARVEISVPNPEHRLKPGMFIRAAIVLDRVADAVIVPEQALANRNNQTGIFVVSEDGRSVIWREVQVGLREGERVQVLGEGLSGRVVILGQQLMEDGSAISIPGEQGDALVQKPKVDAS